MKIAKFQFNMFGENCYVLYDPESGEAMIVDPGMINRAEEKVLDDFIADKNLRVKYLVNTHLHLDHCFGNRHIEQKYGLNTMANPADAPLGKDISAQARMFGLFDEFPSPGTIEPLRDGDELQLGGKKIEVIATPGHTLGGISLYAPEDGWVITGDTLFGDGNIGRTDLPGGDYPTLMRSVERLHKLPAKTLLLPGHGATSTIGDTQAF